MILLSFDTEEFDVPREHGVDFSLEEGMKVSVEGTNRILDVLKENQVKATFFCTGNFAEHAPAVMQRIMDEGHEVACHGVDHWQPKDTDFELSKQIVERVTACQVYGYRQPRMFPVLESEIKRVGYLYNSSLNPAFIPGRYNNVKVPRKPFEKDGIIEIPTSVATFFRIPLFWLALHLFPVWLYLGLVKKSLKKTGFFATYFHPWEFANISGYKAVPGYIRRSSGDRMVERLNRVVVKIKKQGNTFCTYSEFVDLTSSPMDKT